MRKLREKIVKDKIHIMSNREVDKFELNLSYGEKIINIGGGRNCMSCQKENTLKSDTRLNCVIQYTDCWFKGLEMWLNVKTISSGHVKVDFRSPLRWLNDIISSCEMIYMMNYNTYHSCYMYNASSMNISRIFVFIKIFHLSEKIFCGTELSFYINIFVNI